MVLAAYRSLPGAHSDEEYDLELADIARRAEEAEVLVAVEGGSVIGCVTFVPDAASPWAELLEQGEAGVRMLAVAPARQGGGIGTALLASCVARASGLGRRALVLHSTPWMTTAHHLYESAGFVRLPARDWRPVPDVPLLCFRLDLAEGRLRNEGSAGASAESGF